jgi:hypothetical protein
MLASMLKLSKTNLDFELFLLQRLGCSFKNPTSVNSSVKIIHKGNSESQFFCTSSANYFVCKKPTNGLKK